MDSPMREGKDIKSISCHVCDKPFKALKRCKSCKSTFYWYDLEFCLCMIACVGSLSTPLYSYSTYMTQPQGRSSDADAEGVMPSLRPRQFIIGMDWISCTVS